MLGATVPARGGLHQGFVVAKLWGCECVQIYLTPSRTWNVPSLSEQQKQDFQQERLASAAQVVVSHVPYLVNLASQNLTVQQRARERMLLEIKRAEELQVPFLILHPGSHPERAEGKRLFCKNLSDILQKTQSIGVRILLENSAGQGHSLGASLEELHELMENCHPRSSLGICLDTAHLFAAGYWLNGGESYTRFMKKLEDIFDLETIKVIHLNDSKTPFKSRVDRHAPPGQGMIGLPFFQDLIQDDKWRHIPKILELTPETTPSTLKMLKDLRKK